jgi:hypothetical protein
MGGNPSLPLDGDEALNDLSLSRVVGGALAEAVRTEANARLISAGATFGE